MRNNKTSEERGVAVDDYDLLPYPSMPYAQTQPARLAAVAALHGLKAPPADHARVLELGCAAGGNLIPLAARFPAARFLGVDLARRHIADARRRAGELGLDNIEFQQADLIELPLSGERFDYVICHGVFSWVPRAAQDAILRICRERLADDGLAVISYNVLPGWHLRNVIRDLCVRHAGAEGAPQQRVAKARAILDEIAACAKEGEPYGLLLRNEARFTAHRPASYILGEFLVSDNSPCYFQEFVERARSSGLAYVCEADLEAAVPETLGAAMQNRLRASAGPDPMAIEQYVDYFTGRTFRSSVLAKAAPTGRDYERLRDLHISSELRRDDENPGQTPAYKDASGRAVKSADPDVARALARLSAAYPETLSFAQVAESNQRDGDAAGARIRQALSLLVAAGQAEISTLPLRVGRADADRPRAFAPARAEAGAGQIWITSLSHTAAPLKPGLAVLLPHLDGTSDRARLVGIFAAALARGEVGAPELQGIPLQSQTEAIPRLAALYVDRSLAYLAANALLEPDKRLD